MLTQRNAQSPKEAIRAGFNHNEMNEINAKILAGKNICLWHDFHFFFGGCGKSWGVSLKGNKKCHTCPGKGPGGSRGFWC